MYKYIYNQIKGKILLNVPIDKVLPFFDNQYKYAFFIIIISTTIFEE